MLVEAGNKEGDIVVLKLISGEEIAGRISSTTTTEVKITRPIALAPVQSPNGQIAIGFAPFMFGAEDEAVLTFPRDRFLVLTKARKEVRDQYIQATSKIAVANPGDVPDLSNLSS